jgi:ribosomal protein L1
MPTYKLLANTRKGIESYQLESKKKYILELGIGKDGWSKNQIAEKLLTMFKAIIEAINVTTKKFGIEKIGVTDIVLNDTTISIHFEKQ